MIEFALRADIFQRVVAFKRNRSGVVSFARRVIERGSHTGTAVVQIRKRVVAHQFSVQVKASAVEFEAGIRSSVRALEELVAAAKINIGTRLIEKIQIIAAAEHIGVALFPYGKQIHAAFGRHFVGSFLRLFFAVQRMFHRIGKIGCLAVFARAPAFENIPLRREIAGHFHALAVQQIRRPSRRARTVRIRYSVCNRKRFAVEIQAHYVLRRIFRQRDFRKRAVLAVFLYFSESAQTFFRDHRRTGIIGIFKRLLVFIVAVLRKILAVNFHLIVHLIFCGEAEIPLRHRCRFGNFLVVFVEPGAEYVPFLYGRICGKQSGKIRARLRFEGSNGKRSAV